MQAPRAHGARNGEGQNGSTDTARNVLVVLNEVVKGEGVKAALIDHLAGQDVRLMVVAPALVDSALAHEMGQIDGAIEPAQQRLEQSLQELRRAGIEAIGEVGDSDPILAINDELQKFPADEIILVAHTAEDRAWAERGLLERAHHDFELPITQLTVTRPETDNGYALEAPHLVGVQTEPPLHGLEEGETEISHNFPPLRLRDVIAMIFGIVGSIVLVILAAIAALDQPGSGIEGVAAAKMLIAIGVLLINAAHVVALIFFQSLRYRGVFERFTSTVTIGVTSVAIIVSLLL